MIISKCAILSRTFQLSIIMANRHLFQRNKREILLLQMRHAILLANGKVVRVC